MGSRKDEIEARFGTSAGQYATSASHRGGPDLDRMLEIAAPAGTEFMLDVATGAGNTALAFAPLVKHVTALDLAEGMIAETRARFAAAGLTNGEFVVHDVESLPFSRDRFDLVTSRIAPHHFLDIDRAVAEMSRVLMPGGLLIVVDSMAPQDAATAAFLHEVESMRDPTHVRSLSRDEWVVLVERFGPAVENVEVFPKRHEFEPWVARGGTSEDAMNAVRDRFRSADGTIVSQLLIELDGNAVSAFTDEKVLIAARKMAVPGQKSPAKSNKKETSRP